TILTDLFFQGIIPVRFIDIYRPDFHTVLSRVNDNLCRLIKSHRKAVQQGARKHIGIITLEPGRNINQKCKAHGMTFRKSITPKSFQLPEYPFRIVATVPVSCHSLDQLIPEVRYLSIYLKGCHAPSQLVRFSRRKTSGNDGNLHGLLLEQRYPQGATKNILKFFGGILHGLLTVTSTQVWVHHIALDGSRSD